MVIELRHLTYDDLGLFADIDRAEQVDVMYRLVDDELSPTSVDIEVPPWDPAGSGEHSVAHIVDFCAPLVSDGAIFVGAFDRQRVAGLDIVVPDFEPGLAWLAILHVSRWARRRGVGSTLWNSAVETARAAGAQRLYVSAAPTRSAVDFYLSHGCRLAGSATNSELHRQEPDDIHLICHIA